MKKIILILALAVLVTSVHFDLANAVPTKHDWTPPENSGGGDDDEPLKVEPAPLTVDRSREARRAEPPSPVFRIRREKTQDIVPRRRLELLWIWMMQR